MRKLSLIAAVAAITAFAGVSSASADGVHSPSRNGTIPSATQRRRVAVETESARATSVSESAMRASR